MKRLVSMTLLAVLLTMTIPAPTYAAWQADDTIVTPSASSDGFGQAIDIDHNANGVFMAVTGPSSNTYIYKYNTGTSNWDLEDTIAQGGYSVSIALDFVVINNQTNNYIYKRSGTSWSSDVTLPCASSCGVTSDAIDLVNTGTNAYYLAYGMPGSNTVQIYKYFEAFPGFFTWASVFTIDSANVCSATDCTSDVGDKLGDSVSLSSDGMSVAIGAPEFDHTGTVSGGFSICHNSASSCGAAFVYRSLDGGTTLENGTGTPSFYLYSNDSDQNAKFGASVKMTDTNLAVGAELGYTTEVEDGSIYMFDWNAGGDSWDFAQEFEGSLGLGGNGEDDGFGLSIDMSGIYLIAGAPNHDLQSGVAYIFENSGGTWSEIYDFGPSSTDFGGFGKDVALDGNDYYSASGSPGLNPSQISTLNDQGAGSGGGAVPEFHEWVLIITVMLAIGFMWKYLPKLQAPQTRA